MSNRIAILIPSRDRPELMWKAVQSILNTSEAADVYCYVDSDQRDAYTASKPESLIGVGGLKLAIGPRVGPIGAAQMLTRVAREDKGKYAAIGLFVDDCTFTVPGWDQAVLYEAERLGSVWAMSPPHSQGAWMDFALVSDEWVERLGWIAYPALYHFGWPSIIEALGEATTLYRLPPELMFIQHDRAEPLDIDKSREDLRQIHGFFTTNRFQRSLELLRTKRPVEELV